MKLPKTPRQDEERLSEAPVDVDGDGVGLHPSTPAGDVGESLEPSLEEEGSQIGGGVPHERPELFATLDHRAWLASWFQWKKAQNPRFSHRLFARLAGLRSPSHLLLVMQGQRNLTQTTLPGVCRALDLDAEETEYLGLLVELDGTEIPEQREALFLRLSAMRRFQTARRLEGETYRYLASWHLPAVRELANLPGFRGEPAWVAASMRPALSVQDAAEALSLLQVLGLLVPDAAGRLRPADATLTTPHEVAGLAARSYHRGMLQLAADSMANFPSSERHLGAITVSVPDRLLPVLKRELMGIQERLLDLCDGTIGEGERIVQINFQMFPLSVHVPKESK